jgi:hypothetical protein
MVAWWCRIMGARHCTYRATMRLGGLLRDFRLSIAPACMVGKSDFPSMEVRLPGSAVLVPFVVHFRSQGARTLRKMTRCSRVVPSSDSRRWGHCCRSVHSLRAR